MSELRKFNAAGSAAFQSYLDSCTSAEPLAYPEAALTDLAYSEAIESDVTVEPREFQTRLELAEYLHGCFERGGYRSTRQDSGLWNWLSCYYFREICPKDRAGKFAPGASPRWILLGMDWKRYYRHLIAGPYQIYVAHLDNPKNALAVLCQRPGRPGDVVEQIASRQEVVTSPGVLAFATECFVDSATRLQRRGANSKGMGGARRFTSVLSQFDVTWDLSCMTQVELKEMMFRAVMGSEL